MKIILDTGQEIPITFNYIREGERIQEVTLPNGDLLFIQLLEGWSQTKMEDQLQAIQLPELIHQ